MWWRVALGTLLFTACLAVQAGTHDAAVEALQQLLARADSLHQDARFKEGLALAERALAISEATLGPEHPQSAAALEHVARFTHANGNSASALQLSRRALDLRTQALGPEHVDTARSLQQVADLSRYAGDVASAEQLFQRAVAVREKVLGAEHPTLAESLHGLASLYWMMTRYARAGQLYRRALSIQEKHLGAEHPLTIKTLYGLGNVLVDLGDAHAAQALFERVISLREKILRPGHPDIGAALLSLSELYAITGAHEKAIPLAKRVLLIYEAEYDPEHTIFGSPLRSLAMMYSETSAHAMAVPLMRRALQIYEKSLPPGHPGLLLAIASLAILHERMGEFESAAPLYQRALDTIETAHAAGSSEALWAQSNAAAFYASTGAHARAEQLQSSVLVHKERLLGAGHPHTVEARVQLGMTQWALGKTRTAATLLQRAQDARGAYSARLLAAGPEARKQAYLHDTERELFKLVSFSTAMRGARGTSLGLNAVLQHKGRALDATSDGIARLRQSIDPADRQLFEQLTSVAAELSALTYQGIGALSAADYQRRLAELAARQQELETRIAGRSSDFQRQRTPASLASIRGAIPKDAALIEWFRYQPFDPKRIGNDTQWGAARYVAYLLEPTGAPQVFDLGPAADIERLAGGLRRSVSSNRSKDVARRAAALSQRILAPLLPQLRGVKHLLLSPDGELNLVPMAVLLDEQGRYLVQTRELTYLSSGRDLLRFVPLARSTATAPGRIVIIADPAYGPGTLPAPSPGIEARRSADLDRSGITFRSLPGTLQEARALQRLLRTEDANVLLQQDATETRLKQLARPRILHVATHGFFLSDQELAGALRPKRAAGTAPPPSAVAENPLLRAGIALAGANTRRSGEDDGVLTALEVAQLDLRGTELVVLSACETAAGEVHNGAGVYGLRRALTLAGAQSHVTSLWRVADAATQDLMVDYYQRLLAGAGRSAALQAAQRALLGSPRRAHPYYWAGFVPSGHWAPLRALR